MGLSKRLPSRHFLFWKFIFTLAESRAHGGEHAQTLVD